MAQLALRQATIEYQEFGPKDSPHAPVLFVHGILVDGRLWREVAEGLARRGFRCIVPTLPLGSHTIPVNEAAALSLPGVAEMINDPNQCRDQGPGRGVGSAFPDHEMCGHVTVSALTKVGASGPTLRKVSNECGVRVEQPLHACLQFAGAR
jgi:hypothetical protein